MNQEHPTPGVPQDEPDEALYEVVAARRAGYDSMMWQTPVLSLTAQAFLLTIALGAGSSRLARALSGALALISSLASIQLMLKHRYMEISDANWLEEYEKKWCKCPPPHAKRTYPSMPDISAIRWLSSTWKSIHESAWVRLVNVLLVRLSSYHLWLMTLLAFGVVALCAILIAGCRPRWFE